MATIQVSLIAETREVHLAVKEELNKAGGRLKSELVDSSGEMNAKLNGSWKKSKSERKDVNTEIITYTLELQQPSANA